MTSFERESPQLNVPQWDGTKVVIDTGWGDNGKGKIVDVLGQHADLTVRFNGGPNAGHTVNNDHGEFKFHLVPSGIFNPNTLCIIASTVVINPFLLSKEIREVREKGVEINKSNLLISKNSHLIMPWHVNRDELKEVARGGSKIGTTGQGVGPTYADRTERVGLRVSDLMVKQ